MSRNSRYSRKEIEKTICRYVYGHPPGAMYDIGVGVYSEWETLKRVYPCMQLFGCEPHPEEYREVLPLFDGKLLNVALDSTPGKRVLNLTAKGVGGSSFQFDTHRQDGGKVEVETMTLDQFDELAGKPDRILLWADVEGHELEVLRSGRELLASGRVHWLNLETRGYMDKSLHPNYPTTADIDVYLKAYGYKNVHRYGVQGDYPEAPGDCIYIKKRG